METAVLEQKEKEIVIVEGQGSILHPGSTATLPLMRGTCPTHMILCHIARNDSLRSLENIKIPDLKKFIELNERSCFGIGNLSKSKSYRSSTKHYLNVRSKRQKRLLLMLKKKLASLPQMLLGMEVKEIFSSLT